jgi:sugar phosphate isomerase/epimerase
MKNNEINPKLITRRKALKTIALGIAGTTVAGTWLHARQHSSKRALRVGMPFSFPATDPVAWANKARELGLGAVYPPGMSLDDKDYIRAIMAAVKEHGLVFAEVGRWVNMLDADPQVRAKNIRFVTEGLALAEEIGARSCINIAGSYNTNKWDGPHPKNLSEACFEETVENVRKIIDAVKPKRAKFALEMMGWTIPDSPDSYLQLIKAIDRQAFGVHVDVCNLINSPGKFWNNTQLIHEVFDKLGPMILSAHAKDLRWIPAPSIHFEECVIGEGNIDFATYMKRLLALEQDVPLMIEHMKSAEEYDSCKRKLFDIGKSAGIEFNTK